MSEQIIARALQAVAGSRGSVILSYTFSPRGRIRGMVFGRSRGGHPTEPLLGFGIDRATAERGVEALSLESWSEALGRAMGEGSLLVVDRLGEIERELLGLLGRTRSSAWVSAPRIDLAQIADALLRQGVALPGLGLKDYAAALDLPPPPARDPLARWAVSAAAWDLLLLPALREQEPPVHRIPREASERRSGDPIPVPASWLPQVRMESDRLDARLKNEGHPSVVLSVGPSYVAPWPEGGDPLIELVSLTVGLESPLLLGDWSIAGELRRPEGYESSIFRPAPGGELGVSQERLTAMTTSAPRCEACGELRGSLWLLGSSDGQFRLIGRECLTLVTDRDPSAALRLIEELEHLIPNASGSARAWPRPEPLLGVRATITRAARIAVRDGWQGRLDPEPTAALVAAWNAGELDRDQETLGAFEQRYPPTAEADELTSAAARHLGALLEVTPDALGDFERALVGAARSGYHRRSESGVIGSSVVPALREIERARIRAEAGGFRVGGGFIGALGEPLSALETEILEVREFSSDWGPRLRIRARTVGGEQVAWWSKPHPELLRGARLLIDGTVRSHEHDRADALPRTELERVRITAVTRER